MKQKLTAKWEKPIQINNIPVFEDAGLDAQFKAPGKYGSEYGRLLILRDSSWLVVYTVYKNNGYTCDARGGTELEFAVSRDEGTTWQQIAAISHPSRDLDNGQMIELDNGDILMACRSVRWHESYQLHVYKSTDQGKSWAFWSVIDEMNGAPGSLGNPDKGLYEPHFYKLEDGRVSVMYANEKHVIEPPYYSQIVSQKVSCDDGRTWGEEIMVVWDPSNPQLRPGMPVWLRMKDGRYIVVFEVVYFMMYRCISAAIYYKISNDGVTWDAGIGTRISDQDGGPYIAELADGTLLVTSNSGRISTSRDWAQTWELLEPLPFPSHLWASLYTLEHERILLLNSCRREEGGNSVGMCIAALE